MPFKLVWRNLLRQPLRTLLTLGSLAVAIFLLCALRSLLTTLSQGAQVASTRRLMVQSAVSLFENLPLSYQARIAALPGVDGTCKWQYFGAYFQDPRNLFAQFATDLGPLLEIYPEFEIVAGSREALLARRTACMIGEGLSEDYAWRVGDTIPLIGALFPHPEGFDVPWTFEVAAIYRPNAPNFDAHTLFFDFRYLQESLAPVDPRADTIGLLVAQLAPGADRFEVADAIDAQFANGPQRTQTASEAEFTAQYVSMIGNVPLLLSSIGGGVLVAVLLACVNSMLLAAREQVLDNAILKALGFRRGHVVSLALLQSLLLCALGGAAGIAIALALAPPIAEALGQYFPGYAVTPQTVALAAAASLGVGVLAGIAPAVRASGVRAAAALKAVE